jgi:RNA polymerase sigma-70 factor (ECF subfamily)
VAHWEQLVTAIAEDGLELTLGLEAHRTELIGYCYRMLGSAFEAEDAVQETLWRAWHNQHRFDARRAPLRSWVYSIATNVCVDMLRSSQRRARPMDLSPEAVPGPSLGAPLPETAFVQPIPDSRILQATGDPAELAAHRDTIRLAFVAALQYLPPRQRAVLILRDVLCWSAHEVAQLLDTSVASANSALQRARSALTAKTVMATPLRPMNPSQTELLVRYCDAFERYDIETLVSLLHEDATFSMPPFVWWLRGRLQIRQAMLAAGHPCEGARLIPTAANGSPAFAQYRPTGPGGSHKGFALVVLDVADGLITDITNYLDAQRLFPLFDLPYRLDR